MIQWFTLGGEAITVIQTFFSWHPNHKQKQQFRTEYNGLSLLLNIKQDCDAERWDTPLLFSLARLKRVQE